MVSRKPKYMSEYTLEALSSHISCPICHATGVNLEQVTLQRLENDNMEYRKVRHIRGICKNCLENGRGDVSIDVYQRF